METLHIKDVDAADYGLHFLLYGDGVEDALIADKGEDLRPYLRLYDGELGTAHQLGRLVNDHLRKPGFLQLHPLLSMISMETVCLFCSISSCCSFCFLCFLSEKI